jgi:hypothetical protein
MIKNMIHCLLNQNSYIQNGISSFVLLNNFGTHTKENSGGKISVDHKLIVVLNKNDLIFDDLKNAAIQK